MSPSTKNGPRSAATDTRARNVNRGTGRRDHPTTPLTPGRSPRFVQAHPWSRQDVERALAAADAPALARALDEDVTSREASFRCPTCDLKSAYAASKHHWLCDACQQMGSWVALQYHVALSVEACIRLCRIVHGVEVGRPARDAS